MGWSAGGAVAAIVGTFSDSASESAYVSDGSHSTTAHPLTCSEKPCGLCLPAEKFHNRVGMGESRGSIYV